MSFEPVGGDKMARSHLKATVTVGYLVAVALCGQANAQEMPEIAGVFGLASSGEQAWLAVRVVVPTNYALAGVTWYNNDEEIVFPRLLVGTGYPANPGVVSEFTEVATQLTGPSSGWSQSLFDVPVAASLEAIYVAFELPAEIVLNARGVGGGPGIGYVAGTSGCAGWLSGDGEVWARLHEDYGFAVLPQFVSQGPGMLVKSLDGSDHGPATEVESVSAPYLLSAPNPFNPRTELRFGLTQPEQVKLDVFDLRGRRVAQLVDQVMPRGHHTVTWIGCDFAGRSVASGIYFAKLTVGSLNLTERLVLLK